jgi:hypothetical protein
MNVSQIKKITRRLEKNERSLATVVAAVVATIRLRGIATTAVVIVASVRLARLGLVAIFVGPGAIADESANTCPNGGTG